MLGCCRVTLRGAVCATASVHVPVPAVCGRVIVWCCRYRPKKPLKPLTHQPIDPLSPADEPDPP